MSYTRLNNQDLETALRELAESGDLEDVLTRHPNQAAALEPLLYTVSRVRRHYERVPAPPKELREGKRRMLREAAQMRAERTLPRTGLVASFSSWLRALGGLAPAWRTVIVTTVVLMLVTSLSSGVVLAAEGSVPGDLLYPVKSTVEDVRLSIEPDEQARVALVLFYSNRRVQDIERAIDQGRAISADVVVRLESQFLYSLEAARAASALPDSTVDEVVTSDLGARIEDLAELAERARMMELDETGERLAEARERVERELGEGAWTAQDESHAAQDGEIPAGTVVGGDELDDDDDDNDADVERMAQPEPLPTSLGATVDNHEMDDSTGDDDDGVADVRPTAWPTRTREPEITRVIEPTPNPSAEPEALPVAHTGDGEGEDGGGHTQPAKPDNERGGGRPDVPGDNENLDGSDGASDDEEEKDKDKGEEKEEEKNKNKRNQKTKDKVKENDKQKKEDKIKDKSKDDAPPAEERRQDHPPVLEEHTPAPPPSRPETPEPTGPSEGDDPGGAPNETPPSHLRPPEDPKPESTPTLIIKAPPGHIKGGGNGDCVCDQDDDDCDCDDLE